MEQGSIESLLKQNLADDVEENKKISEKDRRELEYMLINSKFNNIDCS
jgi:predicted NUDIX family phosphoesterase